MVHLTLQSLLGPPFELSQALMLDPRWNNLISWARSNEEKFYSKANSRSEYFRWMALIIYKHQMEIEEKRAKRQAGNAINVAQIIHSAQEVLSGQGNPMHKEPNHLQIDVVFGRKFVRPYNFKRGCRRKFYLFAEDQEYNKELKHPCSKRSVPGEEKEIHGLNNVPAVL